MYGLFRALVNPYAFVLKVVWINEGLIDGLIHYAAHRFHYHIGNYSFDLHRLKIINLKTVQF